jgi:predicted RNA polymerase sigma factor
MNRAVAVARVHGPQAGMEALDAIRQRSVLESNHLYHAMRGTFSAELGQTSAAITHFRQAAKLALLPIEREFIAQRIQECEAAVKV